MMKALLIGFILLLAESSYGAITVVHISSTTGSTGFTTLLNLSQHTTAGNLLLTCAINGDNTQTLKVSSTDVGDIFVPIGNSFGKSVTSLTSSLIFYSSAAVGGATKQFITWGGSSSFQAILTWELSGASLVAGSIVDVSTNCTGAHGATTTTPTTAINTTIAADFIASCVGVSNAVTGVQAPYTIESLANGHGIAQHIPAGTVSGEQSVYTNASANSYECSVAAIEPAAAASSSGYNKARRFENDE